MWIYRCKTCGQINRANTDNQARTPHCGKCKEDLDTSGAPQSVKSKNLKRAIANSPVPILLDIWAPWCGPCRMVAPILEEIGQERHGKLLVLKINSDENQDMSNKLKVSGIPTLILFSGGKEADRISGAHPKRALDQWLDQRVK